MKPSFFGAIDMTAIGDMRTNSWAQDPMTNSVMPDSCCVMIMLRSISFNLKMRSCPLSGFLCFDDGTMV
jgi:hypothetical protein